MKLPNQTKGVVRKTFDANAVTVGINASAILTPMITNLLYPQLGL